MTCIYIHYTASVVMANSFFGQSTPLSNFIVVITYLLCDVTMNLNQLLDLISSIDRRASL